MIVTVLFLGSMQLIGLGIIGEYLRLIFLEAKGRPSYIVAERRPDHPKEVVRGPHRTTSGDRSHVTLRIDEP